MSTAKVGPYALIHLLGRGGYGEVWRARDPALGRDVALKILRFDEPDELKRFVREAQTAASLSHPNIAAVYRAEDNWIAMELVDGETARPGPDAPRVARDAARAVAHAHSKGVIHRDLKPSNIMVDKAGRVFVMDFGLARQIKHGGSITRSGMMIGTPAYMSPEQAQGRRADPRSDVYSLGATLHQLLSGRAPFESSDVVDLLMRVVSDEPAPLPGDLGTIVMKCLEKDPARRYPTADALADDLDRFLAGEPISARPPSLAYVLRRRLSRSKASLSVGAAALAGLAVAGALILPKLRSTEQQLGRAEEVLLAQMRELTDAHLRTAVALRRSGDLDGMREIVPRAERVCGECAAKLPRLSEPHTRLGVIYRAALRFDDALAEQEQALAKNPADAEARYERGFLRCNAYANRGFANLDAYWREAGEQIGAAAPADLPTRPTPEEIERRDPEMRRLKAGALEDFAACGDRPIARALTLQLHDRLEEALAILLEAARREPPPDDVLPALGETLRIFGRCDEAVAWQTEALRRDRGDLYALAGRSRAHFESAVARLRGGLDPSEPYARSIEDCDALIRLAPANVEHLRNRARSLLDLGFYRKSRGGDPSAEYDAAMRDLDRAIRVRPHIGDLWALRGSARTSLGFAASERGGDPGSVYADSVRDFDEAVRLAPQDEGVRISRGRTRLNWGLHLQVRRESPEEQYAAAVLDLDAAIRLHPARATAWIVRALARSNWGVWLRAQGGDPTEFYRAALDDYDAAIRLDATVDTIWLRRGQLRVNWGKFRDTRREPADDLYRAAAADYDRAIAINAGRDLAWISRGYLRSLLAERPGADSPASFRRDAVQDLTKAIEINPRSAEAFRYRGYVLQYSGRPADALADYERALEINANLRTMLEKDIAACREALK